MTKSVVRGISAGIIQGSAIGPASFVVNSGDLKAITPGSSMCKYADDTYFIIPSANEGSRTAELANVASWSQKNNSCSSATRFCIQLLNASAFRSLNYSCRNSSYSRLSHTQSVSSVAYPTFRALTNRFKNSFLPFCFSNYQ